LASPYVRNEDVEAAWPMVEPFVAMACEKVPTDLTPDFILEGARDGRFRLWLILDGEETVAAFPMAELPDGTAQFYTVGGSRMTEWMPVLLPQFAEMARASGMRALRLDGRKGWERQMARYGFRTIKRDGSTVMMDLVF
jgi:hypothetical protein